MQLKEQIKKIEALRDTCAQDILATEKYDLFKEVGQSLTTLREYMSAKEGRLVHMSHDDYENFEQFKLFKKFIKQNQ